MPALADLRADPETIERVDRERREEDDEAFRCSRARLHEVHAVEGQQQRRRGRKERRAGDAFGEAIQQHHDERAEHEIEKAPAVRIVAVTHVADHAVEERPSAETVTPRHATEEHHRECDQKLAERRMRVFVDAQVLQILFTGTSEVCLVEDAATRKTRFCPTGGAVRPPIADKGQNEIPDSEHHHDRVVQRHAHHRQAFARVEPVARAFAPRFFGRSWPSGRRRRTTRTDVAGFEILIA